MADLDQGGSAFQFVNVNLGPTLGWFRGQVESMPQRRITVGGATNIGAGDSLVLVDAGANNVTLNLPDVTQWLAISQVLPLNISQIVPYVQGFERAIWIKDFGGNAATNNISIVPYGTQTIDKFNMPFKIVQARMLLRLYPIVSGATGWLSG